MHRLPGGQNIRRKPKHNCDQGWLWAWSEANVVSDAVTLTTHFGDPANIGISYAQKQGETTEDVETPFLLLIPAGLVEWLLVAKCSP